MKKVFIPGAGSGFENKASLKLAEKGVKVPL